MCAVREPAVAGLFYPEDPAALTETVRKLLAGATDAAPDTASGESPKAVIAPHAGYDYSGPVAARAFRPVAGAAGRVRRVLVIGPAHYVPVAGLAAPAADAFRTPLGAVPVDRAALDGLRDLPQVAVSDEPHRREHALEVELPFLQLLLGEFALVPLLVGAAAAEQVAEVLARLWGGAETLIVVSSDLSHYLGYAAAKRIDAATAAAIERCDPSAIGPDQACGHLPVRGLLTLARRGHMRVERRDLRNSGDTSGSRGRVVGYGAWAFYEAAP